MGNDKLRDFDISSRVTIHDIHQVEIKLEYNLEELQETNNYKIETYFFIPKSLQVDEDTYPREEFYNDLQNYIRFKTPGFSLKLLLDPQFTGSPLNVLGEIRESLAREKERQKRIALVNKAIKELKLLGSMMLARLRDFRYFIKRKVGRLSPDKSTECEMEYPLTRIRNAVERGTQILERLRALHRDYMNNFPQQEELFKYFQILEEFISHLLEDELCGIILMVKPTYRNNPILAGITKSFQEFCRAEKRQRSEENFHLRLDESDSRQEQYIYYMSQCKKILSSVLYLDVIREKKEGTYVHAVSSLAAFTASLIYFAATFYVSQGFALNSLPFVLLLSLGYVFKDRLKDAIKLIFNPRVLSRFPDHVNHIKDNWEGKPIILGEIREKVFFGSRQKTDPVILAHRDMTRPASFLPEESPEAILGYQKEININTAAIMERHSRTVNLTDIMRFNIRKYLLKMDDPEHVIHYYDENIDSIRSSIGERTYHLNMVLKYSKFLEKSEKIKYERFRLVLNKWGIQRVEFIEKK
jgi:hypothetical protein